LSADAYCGKIGFGFRELVGNVSDQLGQPTPRTSSPSVGGKPARARWDGASRGVVSCGDCLHEFNLKRIFHVGGERKRTICVHCGNLFEFLVASDGSVGCEVPKAEN